MPASDWGTLGDPIPSGRDTRILHVARVGTTTLRHAYYARGARVPLHRHEVPAFVYGVGGPCLERADEAVRSRSRFTFHPAGFEHSLTYEGPTHVVTIEIDPRHLERSEAQLLTRSVPLPATLYDLMWRTFVKLSQRKDDAALSANIEDLLEETVRWSRSRPPAWLSQTIDHIHHSWRVSPSVKALSAMAALSPPHVCRAFKRYVGVSLQQYGVLLRLDRARGLLWATETPISEIAAETGFADQSHLTRALAAHSDLTPALLRRAAPCLLHGHLPARQPRPAIV